MAHPMYHPVAILSGDKEIVLLTVPIKNICINGVAANQFTRKHLHGPSKGPRDDNTALHESNTLGSTGLVSHFVSWYLYCHT